MNIFVLHPDPGIAARMQCDRHVVKMTLESAQMLCTVINELGGQTPYASTHVNHPCSVWARKTMGNFLWLWEHGMALANEYTERYSKVHKSEAVIRHCRKVIKDVAWLGGPDFKSRKVTSHPLCMPDKYKSDDVFESYRRFYIGEKAGFAQWNRTTEAPSWWQTGGE